ncbi:MAG: GNAT family N-acetyltransferase [gamma proteobacterium symbiont of Taylorina sp.]|nr:GNAT family N-acetyltransferase [gamma proteobacterium symbiont of Taylorina sp.]
MPKRHSPSHANSQEIVAYLRVVFPGYKYQEPSIGRILTKEKIRGTGLGKELLRIALLKIETQYRNVPVRISAQAHLNKFYSQFGFEKVSEPYDEDGIVHIEMLK